MSGGALMTDWRRCFAPRAMPGCDRKSQAARNQYRLLSS
jgi:hypothetical protein